MDYAMVHLEISLIITMIIRMFSSYRMKHFLVHLLSIDLMLTIDMTIIYNANEKLNMLAMRTSFTFVDELSKISLERNKTTDYELHV